MAPASTPFLYSGTLPGKIWKSFGKVEMEVHGHWRRKEQPEKLVFDQI